MGLTPKNRRFVDGLAGVPKGDWAEHGPKAALKAGYKSQGLAATVKRLLGKREIVEALEAQGGSAGEVVVARGVKPREAARDGAEPVRVPARSAEEAEARLEEFYRMRAAHTRVMLTKRGAVEVDDPLPVTWEGVLDVLGLTRERAEGLMLDEGEWARVLGDALSVVRRDLAERVAEGRTTATAGRLLLGALEPKVYGDGSDSGRTREPEELTDAELMEGLREDGEEELAGELAELVVQQAGGE